VRVDSRADCQKWRAGGAENEFQTSEKENKFEETRKQEKNKTEKKSGIGQLVAERLQTIIKEGIRADKQNGTIVPTHERRLG